jgi:hypothetical protein
MRIADDGFVYAEHTILASIIGYIGKRRVFARIAYIVQQPAGYPPFVPGIGTGAQDSQGNIIAGAKMLVW